MARIRTIKPEFFSHRELAMCSPHARLLAIGLLTMADCEGRIEYIPMQVHAGVFPWETSVCVPEILMELQRVGYVQKYTDSGREYLQIVNFKKHQRITGKEAQQRSKLPEPKGISPIDEGEVPGCFPGKYLDAQGTGEQGKEIQDMSADADEPEIRPAKQPASARFVEFWDAYPRREGKKAALQAWQSKRLDRLADSIIEDVNRRKASHRPWLDGFVPHAATYLRGERWCDDLTTGLQPKPNGLRCDGPPILRELQ